MKIVSPFALSSQNILLPQKAPNIFFLAITPSLLSAVLSIRMLRLLNTLWQNI